MHSQFSCRHTPPSAGDVEVVGDGRVGSITHAFTTKPGDTVIYSKFGLGATELQVGGTEYILIREDDLIGIMPRSAATAEDIPELRPIGDRVLLQARLRTALGFRVNPEPSGRRLFSGRAGCSLLAHSHGLCGVAVCLKFGCRTGRIACKAAHGPRAR